jgi:molybdenum cofactor cytidylyltransferase
VALTVAALLAAGEGQRFRRSGGATHKLHAPAGADRVIDRSLGALLASGLAPVAVVVGAVGLDPLPPHVVVLPNPDWAQGMGTSLAVALRWAEGLGADALVVGLADQPGVGPDAWRAVADAPAEPPVAVATYGGRRGNPVRLGRGVWPLLPRTGDQGARAVIRERPDLVQEVPCEGSPDDVDTVEDLERWS